MFRLFLCALVALVCAKSLSAAESPAAGAGNFSLLGSDLSVPATVHVHAMNLALDNGTCLTAKYEWDFGDPAARYNKLRGFSAAHTYDRPGDYTIKLTLTTESGARREFVQRLTVRAPGAQIIYVSQNGNDRFDGATPATAFRTVQRAIVFAGNNARVLLRRGDRFEVPNTLKLNERNLVIGAYGLTGTDVLRIGTPAVTTLQPALVYTGPRNGQPIIQAEPISRNIVIENIAFDSVFTRDLEKKNMPPGVRPTGSNLTVRRCTFLNVSDGVTCNARPTGVLMQDCAVPSPTTMRSYIAWIEGTDQAYIGNYVANSTREAAMRVGYTGGERILIANNVLTNLDRTSIDRIDIAKNALTVHYGKHIYIAGNTFRTGPVMIGPLGEADGVKQKGDKLEWSVFENNRVEHSGLRVNHGALHLMIRSNRFWSNDRWAINVEGFNADYNRGSADISIERNTARNTGSKGNFARIGGKVDGISLVGNLYSAPRLAPGGDMTAVVYVGQKDLKGFNAVSGNVWPATSPQPYAHGGMFYVWQSWSDQRGYLDLDRWNQLTQGNDRLEDIQLDEALFPVAGSTALSAGAVP